MNKSAARGRGFVGSIAAVAALALAGIGVILGITGRNVTPGVDLMPPVIQAASPNVGGPLKNLMYVVLHATASDNCAGALSWLRSTRSGVSAHYLVCEDGRIYQLASERVQTWHAGVSSWRGQSALNAFSIGIEISNRNDGRDPYEPAQLLATAQLVRSIKMRYALRDTGVVTHAQIAPQRKTDPAGFPWRVFDEVEDIGEPVTFAEVPFKVYEPFATYWRLRGGLPNLGLPITNEFMEKQEDGVTRRVQYFQRSRIEYDPQDIGKPYAVEQGLIGIEAYNQRYGK